jgi:hypothetical protein
LSLKRKEIEFHEEYRTQNSEHRRQKTIKNYISLRALCSLWLKIKYIYSVAKLLVRSFKETNGRVKA